MQASRAKKERFLQLPAQLVAWLVPLLRVMELQVFLAIWEVAQGRWSTTPIVLASLASRVGRDRAQVRRSLRTLAASGLLQVEAGPRVGTYKIAPAASAAYGVIREELKARKRPRGSARGKGGAQLALVPPLPQPPPPKKKRPTRGKGGDGGDREDPPDTEPLPAVPGLPAPPPPPPPNSSPPHPARFPQISPPPSAPVEVPEPFRLGAVIDWCDTADFPVFSAAQGGTILEAGGGLFPPPISRSGEISKDPRRLVDLDRDPRVSGAEEHETSDETSEEFDSFGEREHEPGRVLTLDEISPPEPDSALDDDPAEQAGERASLAQVEALWLWTDAQGLGIRRGTAAPLLYRLLSWADRYEQARDYLCGELPRVRQDPTVRAPLAFVCHEPRFRAWLASGGVPASSPTPTPRRAPARPVAPNHGPPPLTAEEWAPIAAEINRRMPELDRPGERPRSALLWTDEQAQRNASNARQALAALAGPAAGPTLPAEHEPGATGTIVFKGWRYTRTEAAAPWRRVGRAP